jgi:hypothetical protein
LNPRESAFWGKAIMERIFASAACLLICLVATALAHRPARGLASVLDVTRHDAALWIMF